MTMRNRLKSGLLLGLLSMLFIGNAHALPSFGGDCSVCHIAPTVTDFVLPATHDSLTVPITSFSATDTDNQKSSLATVTGYMVTTSPTAPGSGDSGWQSSPPSEFTFAADGLQTLYAWAKDKVGDVSAAVSGTVEIILAAVNIPPTADAGPDQTVDENVTVQLDGSNSYDADDGIAGILWEQIDGVPVTITDADLEIAAFVTPDVGPAGESLTFQLTVTDYSGAVSTDTCVVNVTWVNMPPVADAGPDQSVSESETVTLSAANSSDPDGAIDGYLWEQTDGPAATLSDPAAAAPTFTAPGAGTNGTALTFQLTVTDDGGLTATDTCVVNVSPTTPVNQPPTADAGADQSVTAGGTVALNGAGSSDPDGVIDVYRWEQTGGPAVTLSDPAADAPTFTAPGTDANGATLEFQLTVIDNGGLQATDTCIVSVASGTVPPPPTDNRPPTADAGPDMRVKQRTSVTLNGTGSSDPDDGIARYRWRQISGPRVRLNGCATAAPDFLSPRVRRRPVRLVFKLIVWDYAGHRSKDYVSVTVVKNDDEDEEKDQDDDDEKEEEHDDHKNDEKDD
jgi:hypothetical protein